MTWVIRDGKLVEKTYAPSLARSDLPCPSIIRDGLLEPLRNMADGRLYDSKRAMSAATKAAGCIEVGNEVPKVASRADPPPVSQSEVAEAYCKVRDGYKPTVTVGKVDGTEAGWIE